MLTCYGMTLFLKILRNLTLTDLYTYQNYNWCNLPKVSVIIPVLNGAQTIQRTLESLFVQKYPTNQLEIIVIDNGSSDGTANLIKQWDGRIQLLYIGKRGSYTARNFGIMSAKGEILAFTDADCMAHKDWLYEGVLYLLNKKVGIVAGNVCLIYRNPPSIVEVYEIQTAFDQEKYVKKRQFGATANLFVHRKVFEKIGLFDESLKSGGDIKFCNYAVNRGEKILFCETAIVYHEARKTMLDLLKKKVRVGVGWGRMSAEAIPSIMQCSKVAKKYPSKQPKITDNLSRLKIMQVKILSLFILVIFNIAYCAGYFMGIFRRLTKDNSDS